MKEKIVYRLSMGFTQSELDWIEETRRVYEEDLGISLSANQAIKALLNEAKRVISDYSPDSKALEGAGNE